PALPDAPAPRGSRDREPGSKEGLLFVREEPPITSDHGGAIGLPAGSVSHSALFFSCPRPRLCVFVAGGGCSRTEIAAVGFLSRTGSAALGATDGGGTAKP